MQEMNILTVNGQTYAVRDAGAVRMDAPQPLTEEQKAQARQNIGVGEGQSVTDEKYFLIDDDGLLSLKPEYRGQGSNSYGYSISDNGAGADGSLLADLPENIVIPDVVNEIAVNALAPAMFYKNYRVKSITIPSCITQIPVIFCAQAGSLERIEGTENIEILGGYAFQMTKIKKVSFPKLKTIEGVAHFAACFYLVSADIGNAVTQLPNSFFRYCERLSSIRGGASLTKLDEGALSCTLRLKNLPFAANLTQIAKLGLHLSRVNYDWSKHTAQYGENATYAHYATYPQINYWSGYWDTHTVTPCEISLRSLFNQSNPQWLQDAKDAGFTATQQSYAQNCAVCVYAAMYSVYEQKDLTSPVEYMLAIQKADPNALNVHPGNVDGPKDWLVPLGYTWEKVDTPTSADGWASAVEKVYKALNEGKLVHAKSVSNTDAGAGNHAVLLYGINSSGEVLVFNPGNYSGTGGDYRPFTYAMPIQNLTAKGSLFHIISKPAQAEA